MMTDNDIRRAIGLLSCISVDDLEETYLVHGEETSPELIEFLHREYTDMEALRDYYLGEIRRMMEWEVYTIEHLKHDFNIVL
ncbi:MAG: hypothetical protein J6X18_13695 [Bacteroidales bacterium]|nr:hypothetical protein [Bacteroidales bacterium]